MKVTRAGLHLVLFLILVGVAGTAARSFRSTGSEQQVTFAQLTDAHLFDRGGKQQAPANADNAPDNWDALHWSIDRINSLAKGGKHIDFVVYTGDLGLQNVTFPDSKACLVKAVHLEAGLPPTREESGANQLIAELDRLAVRNIFFVSGNNDPLEEDTTDGRFECFLLALQERAQWLDRPLRIQRLGPDHCFSLKGFHLLGLNSASFQKPAHDQDVCVPRVQTGLVQQLLDGSCPETQVGVLREQVETGAPTLLFTHVPDLKDPVRQRPAWDLDPRVRREWEAGAHSPHVLGIFAGHFQDPNGGLYGNNVGVRALAVELHVAAKTYLAPPLAIKDQSGSQTPARGFLLVTANPTGISHTEVQWFRGRE